MKKFILLIVILLLPGCGGDGISSGSLSAIMGGTEAVGDDIVEASIAKELAVMNTLKNRDVEYGKAYNQSGFKMTFKVVVLGGVQMYLPDSISYKPEPKFDTPLPTKPSVHPVWETVTNIASVFAKYGLIAYGFHELNSMISSGYAAAGSTYNGPIMGSFNSAGGAQSNMLLRDYAPVTIQDNIFNPSVP